MHNPSTIWVVSGKKLSNRRNKLTNRNDDRRNRNDGQMGHFQMGHFPVAPKIGARVSDASCAKNWRTFLRQKLRHLRQAHPLRMNPDAQFCLQNNDDYKGEKKHDHSTTGCSVSMLRKNFQQKELLLFLTFATTGC